jgi:hypothetical protein
MIEFVFVLVVVARICLGDWFMVDGLVMGFLSPKRVSRGQIEFIE